MRCILPFIAFALAAPAFADHDAVVYQRYKRDEAASPLKYSSELKWTALAAPATAQDVKAGKALFTFEGLGERRVWKLNKTPRYARWFANKRHPIKYSDGSIGYSIHGYVLQAEELLIDGKWKLYFGFLSEHGVAVVPGEEMDLPYSFCDSAFRFELPGGVDITIHRPNVTIVDGQTQYGDCTLDKPIATSIHVGNRRATPIAAPADLYRKADGKHSFRKGMKIELYWAPFDPRDPTEGTPDDERFTPVTAKYQSHDADAGAKGAALGIHEEAKLCAIDLHELFEIRKEGYYRYTYDFDAKALGLPEEPAGGGASIIFTIGKEPRKLTFAEMNAEIGMLGGKGVEARLRKMIKEAFAKLPEDKVGAAALPADFPAFSRDLYYSGNGSGMEAAYELILASNREAVEKLDAYSASSVRAEFEKRMAAEKELPHLRLLYAAIAAQRGSEKGALVILEAMKSTDWESSREPHAALEHLIRHDEDTPGMAPAWAVELAIAALQDDRWVTGLEKTNWNYGTTFRVGYLADEYGNLTWALGFAKAKQAVPALIELVKKRDASRGHVIALGLIGDPRGGPVILDHLKRHIVGAKYHEGIGLEERTERLIRAAAELKLKEAVPTLIEHVRFADAIEALGVIGDERALPALRKVVAEGGDEERVFHARLALATLEPGDPIPRLEALLADKKLNEYRRLDVVYRMRDKPDRRQILLLVKIIKTDPSGAMAGHAIWSLAEIRVRESVDGLIECFAVDFTKKDSWRPGQTAEQYKDEIATALKKLTGQDFGADQAKWKAWWEKNREAFKEATH